MEKLQNYTYDVMEVCVLAGKIMLQSGAETYRVEDTMMRIADAFGMREAHSYVTPTGIIFSLESDQPTKTKLVRITDRTTNLQKVAEVNSISRKISEGNLTVSEAYGALKDVEASTWAYPLFVKILAAGLASGCFLIIFQGIWADFLAAFVAGSVGLAGVNFFQRLVPIRFFAEMVASICIGLVAVLGIKMGWGQELDKIIIGAVMPLVPGLLLTNAVRDLMAGHLLAGMSKAVEAALTAFAIGSGIAIVISFFTV